MNHAAKILSSICFVAAGAIFGLLLIAPVSASDPVAGTGLQAAAVLATCGFVLWKNSSI